MSKIAVYGTLRRGEGNHYLIRNGNYLGSINTEPSFTMYDNGGFPFVFNAGNTSITVEIFEIDSNTLKNVYSLEGYSGIRNHHTNWYDTVDIKTPWGDAEMFICKREKNLKVIQSGDWKNR